LWRPVPPNTPLLQQMADWSQGSRPPNLFQRPASSCGAHAPARLTALVLHQAIALCGTRQCSSAAALLQELGLSTS